MSLMNLPQISALANLPKSLGFDKRPDAVQRWSPDLKAKSDNAGNVITIYDDIGESWYSEGVTAKRIAAAAPERAKRADDALIYSQACYEYTSKVLMDYRNQVIEYNKKYGGG